MVRYNIKQSDELKAALHKRPSEAKRLMGGIEFSFTRFIIACMLIFFENLKFEKIHHVAIQNDSDDDHYEVTSTYKERPKNHLLGIKQLLHHIYSQETLITNLVVNKKSRHRVYMSFRDSSTKQYYGISLVDPAELNETTRQALLYRIGTILFKLTGFPRNIVLDRTVMAAIRDITA